MSSVFGLVGPTASGKTQVALALAPRLDAEIVAVDSMTIYRGMDIGTAKPSRKDRARVPHHLLDIADPRERVTVARFQTAAREAFAHIAARGKRALVTGGSGLYFRAAVDPLEIPPHDRNVRARLEAEPAAVLARRLEQTDPSALRFIDARNIRRVVRALEVAEVTGRPFSAFRSDWERFAPIPVAGLRVPPDVLAERIRARLRAQLDGGLLDEVRALERSRALDGPTASRAIPYPEARALLHGEIDESEFLERATRSNRSLARRQMAWFRRDPRVRWFDAADIESVIEEVAAYYGERAEKDDVDALH